jgi:hypothetical protein
MDDESNGEKLAGEILKMFRGIEYVLIALSLCFAIILVLTAIIILPPIAWEWIIHHPKKITGVAISFAVFVAWTFYKWDGK